MLSLQILINIFILLHVTPIIVKNEFLIVKRSALIELAQSLSFDRRCNGLKRWLLERSYKEKEIRKQVLRGKAIGRDNLLNRERTLREKTQIAFNLTYYLVFKNLRKIFKISCLLLTPDQAHKKVLIIRFKNAKSFKDHLVRAVLPQLNREGRSKPCEGGGKSSM